jgi:hypothetical protein
MQKLDFVKNLEIIVTRLQSEPIVNLFQSGFEKPGTPFGYGAVIPFLFKSKSNFDQIIGDEGIYKILNNLNADQIYDDKFLTTLSTYLINTAAPNLLLREYVIKFFHFHHTLITTRNLAKNVLLTPDLNESFEENLEKGVIILQILIEGDGLETEKYIKIISAVQELIGAISVIMDESDRKPEIILFDSGSDTNMGLKAGAETVKSLFLIFKEIWDFVINRKYYQQGMNNKALLESLSIREDIQKKVDTGILTEDEGKEYAHIIKTRTDDLIGMKVMPKQIVVKSSEVHNKQLLSEFEGYRMLGSRE